MIVRDRLFPRQSGPGRRLLSLGLSCLLVLLARPAPTAAQSPPADLVITGATLIDGTGAPPRRGTSIVVRDGRVVRVTTGTPAAAANAHTRVDARGKFVMPGLADMHVHFGGGGLDSRQPETLDRILRQFLFYGVTTVFSVGGTGGDAPTIVKLREAIESGRTPRPHLYATGSMLTLPGSHPVATIMRVPEDADPTTYDWSTRGVALVETAEEARKAVRENAKAGMDAIKIVVESGPTPFGDGHPQMSVEMIEAVVEEATAHGLPVVAHVSSLDELEASIAGGVHAVMHAAAEPFPGPQTWDAMREHSIHYVPTLSLHLPMLSDHWEGPGALDRAFLRAGVEAGTIESLANWTPPTASMPENLRSAMWDGMLASIAAAHDAGVPIALGTDTNNPFVFPGYSVHVELALYVEAGLTPMQALIAGTRTPAEMLGEEDSFGTIEPGRRADLLVLGADPLEDIRNTRSLEMVVRDGVVVDRESLLEGH